MAPRKTNRLNSDRLNKAKPGPYPDGDGLYLYVTSAKARSWLFCYMLNGRSREMGLGPYPEISLIDARARATEARKLKARGIDPIDDRDRQAALARVEAAKAISFRQCAEGYIEAHKAGWRNAKHAEQWTATLATYAYPVCGDLPVSAVDVGLVLKVLEPIWTTKTETARRLRGRIEAVLDWATAREYRSGDNPARWKGLLKNLLPPHAKVGRVEHHPALPYGELPSFVADLRAQEGLGAECLLFTILTASRTSEAINAQWQEIDLNNAIWTVPGERMKAGREHRVPLSKPALALLRERQKATGGQGAIFPGERLNRPLSNMAMLKTLERMGRNDLTVHGFRSTFRDWVEESTSYAGTVAEAALAHAVADKVEAAYRRGDLFDKRAKLMEAWGKYCMTPARGVDVIPIKRARPGVIVLHGPGAAPAPSARSRV